MECTVYTTCGRYGVHFKSDGKTFMTLLVHNNNNSAMPCGSASPAAAASAIGKSPLPNYAAKLSESHVIELTTAAGVRKSFPKFAEMVYHALIGRSSCVKFFVETCAEMQRRISADVETRRQQHQQERRGDGPDHNGSASAINLSIASDVAEEARSQRFFTLDYDVDFTRAMFPIPLDVVPDGFDADTLTSSSGQPSAAVVAGTAAAAASAPAPSAAGGDAFQTELRSCQRCIEQLRVENARLRDENEALHHLSREKMREMKQLCEDFQHRVHASAEAERLRAKNTDLRVRLHAAEEARASLERALDAERSRRQQPRRISASSREPSPTNPYLRSLSRERSQRRTLVSPTPPGDAKQRSRPTKTSAAGGRFDTPPTSARQQQHHQQQQRSGSRDRLGGGGGDSPAPRGRTGGRTTPSPSSSSSRHQQKVLRPSRSHSADRVSVCSSVGSSSSHERLFRASTASSRSRQTLHRGASDSPIRRTVFR